MSHHTDRPARPVRCAVYTRKSSEEGLDQAFNSLDAQREAGRDYISSQKHARWVPVRASYDDGGYSGGSTERPGLRRLLDDIRAGRVDVVVVYKVDRLSRSLADFARLMQVFDEHGVSFVSVTQQFNTTTSMGRLTLNMLLSFAQFEREVAGERIRDKIAATKRRGVWVCGQPPLGYRLPREGDRGFAPGDRTLRVVETEAALVRAVFDGYLELGSLVELARRLNAAGHTTRRWTSGRGRTHGGRPLTTAYLHRVLTNPIYIGKITHTRGAAGGNGDKRTDVYEGLHEPIIDQAVWDRVREKMDTAQRQSRQRWTHTHLLKGKLRTFEGHAMSPGSVQRPMSRRSGGGSRSTGKRLVRYYVSQKAIKHGYANCPIKSVNAMQMDDLVRGIVLDHLKRHDGIELGAVASPVRDRWIREIVSRVVLAPDRLTIEMVREHVSAVAKSVQGRVETGRSNCSTRPKGTADETVPSSPFAPEVNNGGRCVTLTLPIQIKQHDGRRVLLSPEGHDLLTTVTPDGRPVPREHLVRAIGLAFAWRRELLHSGCSFESIAQRESLTAGRVTSLLNLTRLSPGILRAALSGALPRSVSLLDLLRAAQHLDWERESRGLPLSGPA